MDIANVYFHLMKYDTACKEAWEFQDIKFERKWIELKREQMLHAFSHT